MGRKFSIPEEDFLIESPIHNKEAAEPEKNISETKEKDVLPTAKEIERQSESANLRPAVNNESQTLMVPEENENDYVRVRVGRIQKKETMSVKKMVLMKPSVLARLERVLKTKLPGTSFNSVVNQLIEGWLDEVDTIDSEK